MVNTLVTPTIVTFANSAGNYILSGTGGIGGAASLTVTGSDTVTLSTINTYTGPTTVTGGTLVIGAAAALPSGSAVMVGNGTTPAILQLASGIGQVTLPSLTINPGGVFDITNNTLVINYASGADPVAAIRGYLKSAYQGGIWTGTGLTSSTVRGEVANAIAHGGGVWSIGYLDVSKDTAATSATQIYVEPALIGDANLDGSVTFIDLGIVAQNLGAINDDWEHGDFNYDGTTNFLDIGLLAQNLSKTVLNTPLDEIIPDPSAAVTAQWNLAVAELQANETEPANLPEPGMVGLMALGAGGLMARRRRRRA
jgi:autotransporter-associated beta strand protein